MDSGENVYYIASICNTQNHHEHIMFWGKGRCGYYIVISDHMGQYDEAQAATLNDGVLYIAVPVSAVIAIQSPEPYYKPGARFYDARGPVVENTRKNWNALIKASMKDGRQREPKPNVFRGKRRAVFTEND